MTKEKVTPAALGAGFVASLVPDPSAPPDLTMVTGYLGASALDGHVRLYLNGALSDYLEIPEGAIRHREQVPPSLDPLGAVYLWIGRDSQLIRGGRDQAGSRARFLTGDIQREHQGGPIGPTGVQHCTQYPAACGSTAWPGCPR